MPQFSNARDQLAVALDVSNGVQAEAKVKALGDVPGWIKVGLQLFIAEGPRAISIAGTVETKPQIFLDLKLHDIPNTVKNAVGSAAKLGVNMLTLHLGGGRKMLEAACEAAKESAEQSDQDPPLLVGVTVLTSFSESDLTEVGVPNGVSSQVARLVDLAAEVGLDGVVASAQEAASIRCRVNDEFLIVTPGIRGTNADRNDQARTATATEAISAGANLLVVGRPITESPDPAAAAQELINEISQARRG